MINDIFKTRTCSGCISAALNIYSNNFKKIFRATWLWILILAIVNGAMAFIHNPTMDSVVQPRSLILPAVGMGVILVASFFLVARIIAGVVAILNEVKLKTSLKKVLSVNGLTLCIGIVCGLIVTTVNVGLTNIGAVQKLPVSTLIILLSVVSLVLLIIMAMCLSPLVYSATRYIFQADAKLKEVFGKNYHEGLRRMGFLFSLIIATCLLCVMAGAFLCVPACITIFASNIDSYGVAAGDVSGLPSYFAGLNFLSTAIMTFIVQYIMIFVVLTYFYAYGSVTTINSKSN